MKAQLLGNSGGQQPAALVLPAPLQEKSYSDVTAHIAPTGTSQLDQSVAAVPDQATEQSLAEPQLPSLAGLPAMISDRESQPQRASGIGISTAGKKKRKADEQCTDAAADTEASAALDCESKPSSGHDAGALHVGDESSEPKQERVRVGCAKRPRPGTLQAAFAKVKVCLQ